MQGLVGATGFVGGALSRQRRFDRAYNSKSIGDIAGEVFELLVCAGAPATMWAANAQPDADRVNLEKLMNALKSARIKRLVLISTVAVFDDVSAGYCESDARFEEQKAYGRNRRRLEVDAARSFDCIIMRLPALFGPGLKKNFIFDLLNPVPSFVKPEKFRSIEAGVAPAERDLLLSAFSFDDGLEMWRFNRDAFDEGPDAARLVAIFKRAGFIARDFTNSESCYQYYNIDRLSGHIDACIERGIATLNVCSAPVSARDIHAELFGAPFENTTPSIVREDVRSAHASSFGDNAPYLFGRDEILRDLKAFAASKARR